MAIHLIPTPKTLLPGLLLMLIILLGLTPHPTQAATTPGSVDPTFQSGNGPSGRVSAVGVQSDGKILIGGDFTTYNSTARGHIARLNNDGSLDTSFNIGTGADSIVFALKLQSDGKILIGGFFTNYNGTSVNRIARLNSDGSLDSSFNVGTGVNNIIYAIEVQSDGKILVVGDFTAYNGTNINRIARLNSDGSLDTSFNVGTGAYLGQVNSVAIQSDGKVLIGGNFTHYNGTSINRIARLNSDGSLDTSFNVGAEINSVVRAITVQSDGKILIGGDFIIYNNPYTYHIARLNSDGTFDSNFNIEMRSGGRIDAIVVQSDGKIVIGGDFHRYNLTYTYHIARLNSDGTTDNDFNIDYGVDNTITAIGLQSDGKLVIGGDFTTYSNGTGVNYIARLSSGGTLETSFNSGSGANSAVSSIGLQSNGKILIGGYFTAYKGITRRYIARLNNDGTLDTNFHTGVAGEINGGEVTTVIVQSDDKILISGSFVSYDGTSRNSIARLNSDGTLDNSFNPGYGVNNPILASTMQSDGKVLIGGYFTTYNDSNYSHIARLNSDGSLDTSFNVGSGTDAQVNAIAVQSDGKILIGGKFTNYNSISASYIARLNSDGTFDTSFNVCTDTSGQVNAIAVQSDGKILIGCNFVNPNSTTANRVIRLNSDGTLDNTFNMGAGNNGYIYNITMQSDGKVLIGGSFTIYNGTSINQIARLNSDGSLDTSFNVGAGANSQVNAIIVQSDGKILIGGIFNSVDTYTHNYIARLENTLTSSTSLTSSPNPAAFGQNVTFTATVSPVSASGTVSFTFDTGPTVLATLSGGSATYITNTLPTGSHIITATYSGDSTHTTSFTTTTQLVNQAASAITLANAPNPSLVGQSVIFTATLNRVGVSGTVTFSEGVTVLGTAPVVSGTAIYTTASLSMGSHGIKASYSGDANYGMSISQPVTQVVKAPCIPLVVTSVTDDGTGTNCGTLSYALSQPITATVASPITITFALTQGNIITFTGSFTTTAKVKAGVTIYGGAFGSGNRIILNGNGVAGDGLHLAGNNYLVNLTIEHFGGRELVLEGPGNRMQGVVVIAS